MAELREGRRTTAVFGVLTVVAVFACFYVCWIVTHRFQEVSLENRRRDEEAALYARQSRLWSEIEKLGGTRRAGRLEVIIGSDWKGGNDGLVLLHGLRRIIELTLDSPRVDDGAVQYLIALSSLRALYLRQTRFSSAAMQQVAALPHLHLLELDHANATDEALGAIKQLDLSWLIVALGGSVTDEGVRHLSSQRNLISLRLHSSQVKGATLGELSGLHSLRELDLSGTSVDDEGVVQLSGLDRLHTLDLSGTQIRGRSLDALRGLPRLKELLLENTAVDDESIALLQGLPSLEFLSLDGTGVTDKALPLVARLKSLRSLSVAGTAITQPALDTLRDATGIRTFHASDDGREEGGKAKARHNREAGEEPRLAPEGGSCLFEEGAMGRCADAAVSRRGSTGSRDGAWCSAEVPQAHGVRRAGAAARPHATVAVAVGGQRRPDGEHCGSGAAEQKRSRKALSWANLPRLMVRAQPTH